MRYCDTRVMCCADWRCHVLCRLVAKLARILARLRLKQSLDLQGLAFR